MKTYILATSALVFACVLLGNAQSKTPSESQWQIDAGGKMSFDVASVKQNKSGYPPVGSPPHSNFPFAGDAYVPNGGLFEATNWPLASYIAFAYKLADIQMPSLNQQLPQWAKLQGSDHFDILARADGNPTKEQMRLMMQSLLADRFKLAAHFEVREGPVYALVLVKSGRAGPRLEAHS